MQGIEAAFHRTRAECRPGSRRAFETLEILSAEILKLEEIAEKPSRALGDDDHAWLGDRLKARCEVRRVTNDAALLRVPRSDQVADDDRSRRNANAHAQPRFGGRRELWHRVGERKPDLNRALGIMLVSIRIAKICKHSVAHILGDEAAVALDHLRATAMICADDGAHVLGVEPRG